VAAQLCPSLLTLFFEDLPACHIGRAQRYLEMSLVPVTPPGSCYCLSKGDRAASIKPRSPPRRLPDHEELLGIYLRCPRAHLRRVYLAKRVGQCRPPIVLPKLSIKPRSPSIKSRSLHHAAQPPSRRALRQAALSTNLRSLHQAAQPPLRSLRHGHGHQQPAAIQQLF
jgi:hypothetical protein